MFQQSNHCPACGGPVQVWADRSDGATVNFACDEERCPAGKAPWDTARPATATSEETAR